MEYIWKQVCLRPFYGRMLQAEYLEESSSVRLCWKNTVAEELIQLYFEKNGGVISHIDFNETSKSAVVTFADAEGIKPLIIMYL